MKPDKSDKPPRAAGLGIDPAAADTADARIMREKQGTPGFGDD